MKIYNRVLKNCQNIGKYNGKSHGHEISGYNYLKDKGYDEEYYNI